VGDWSDIEVEKRRLKREQLERIRADAVDAIKPQGEAKSTPSEDAGGDGKEPVKLD
jgi:hypothetical protein